MPAGSMQPSDDGCVSITIPSRYAEDFRAAIVEEIALEAEFIQGHRKKADELEKWDDAKAESERLDMRSDMGLLAADAALLRLVGHAGDGEIVLAVAGKTERAEPDAGTVAHVFESMARKIVGPRLAEDLECGPHDENAAVEIRDLIARLSWAVDQAAESHAVAVAALKREAA